MEREENRRLSGMLKTDMEYLNRVLDVEKNFDITGLSPSAEKRPVCIWWTASARTT